MRSKDPALMERIRDFAERFYRAEGRSPSTGEIAAALAIGRTTAYNYLREMDRRGMVDYDGRSIATEATRKCRAGLVSVPLVGAIPCGTPEEEFENVEEYVQLPAAVFGGEELFLLRAAGDSMADAGIADGDLVVLRRQQTARPGDIVAALTDRGENTLKRLAGCDAATGETVLRYENQEKYPDREVRTARCAVQGVARFVIKSL